MRKGFVRLLEAVLAYVLVLFVIIMLATSQNLLFVQEADTDVYDALKFLDASGELEEFAVTDNITGFRDRMEELVDKPVNIAVGIYHSNAFDPPGAVPADVNVQASTWMVSGKDDIFNLTVMAVYTW